ncbi:MAG: SgcJ/EcaC family oxidoreductase [Acidobacteriia bacterium]|nr:SgcJ/EcaC family oxidoreductase [Terriglobia bacterium]
MKSLRAIVLAVTLAIAPPLPWPQSDTSHTSAKVAAQPVDDQTQVRQVVEEFYKAFNSDRFDRAVEFTTDDWNHITPLGSRTRGRTAVLQQLTQVHKTFLKGVTETIEEIDIRFATPEVAVATVASRATSFTTPDGVRRENPHQIRTFVLTRRNGRWLIMQDHATYTTPAAR